MNFKILLVLPAGERVRVTGEHPEVPRRAMLRFSVLPLTAVAGLTPRQHEVRIVDENVEALDFDTECDIVGITFMTALAPRAYEIAGEFRRRGKVVVAGGYHATLCPEDAAPHFDALVVGDAEGAWERLSLRLGLTYRYDNRREGIVGWNPAAARQPAPTPSYVQLVRRKEVGMGRGGA